MNDRFMQEGYLENLCIIESNLEKINIQQLFDKDNSFYEKFDKNEDVSDEVMKSCISTIGTLMLIDKNSEKSNDKYEDNNNYAIEKCGAFEDFEPFVNVLEHRLFHMCLAHYKNNALSKEPSKDANILFEKILNIVEKKVEHMIKI